MRCSESDQSGLRTGTDPDRAFASDERKGIFADQFTRTFDFEMYRIVCVWSDIAELVRDSQNNARGIGTISDKCVIVRQSNEFSIDAVSSKRPRDDL
jgi:hypothetical protein